MIWAIWYSYSSEFVCFLFVRYTHMHMNFNFSVLVSVVNLRTFRSIRWNFLAAFTAMLGVWAVHVLQDCLYFMFSIWMLCCSLRIKIGTFGFLFLVTDQNLVLFLGPFLLLQNGAEKAKPDYWPSLFPCQFSNSNVDPFLGPCYGPHSESRKFSLYKQRNMVPLDCCSIQMLFPVRFSLHCAYFYV